MRQRNYGAIEIGMCFARIHWILGTIGDGSGEVACGPSEGNCIGVCFKARFGLKRSSCIRALRACTVDDPRITRQLRPGLVYGVHLIIVKANIMADSTARMEPFLIMARSTRGAASAKIVEDVTAAVGAIASSQSMC